jgi:hypothetical protein
MEIAHVEIPTSNRLFLHLLGFVVTVTTCLLLESWSALGGNAAMLIESFS